MINLKEIEVQIISMLEYDGWKDTSDPLRSYVFLTKDNATVRIIVEEMEDEKNKEVK